MKFGNKKIDSLTKNERFLSGLELAALLLESGTHSIESLSMATGVARSNLQKKLNKMVEQGEINVLKTNTNFSNNTVNSYFYKKFDREELMRNEMMSIAPFVFRKNGSSHLKINVNSETKNWYVTMLVAQFDEGEIINKQHMDVKGLKINAVIHSLTSSQFLTFKKPEIKNSEQLIIVLDSKIVLKNLMELPELVGTILVLIQESENNGKYIRAAKTLYIKKGHEGMNTLEILDTKDHHLKVTPVKEANEIFDMEKQKLIAEKKVTETLEKFSRNKEIDALIELN